MAEKKVMGATASAPGQAVEGFKQSRPHAEGCFCADHEKYGQPFIVYRGPNFRLKRNGYKGGSTLWHEFGCNDTKCDATALVRWDVLAEFIVAGLQGGGATLGPKRSEGHRKMILTISLSLLAITLIAICIKACINAYKEDNGKPGHWL